MTRSAFLSLALACLPALSNAAAPLSPGGEAAASTSPLTTIYRFSADQNSPSAGPSTELVEGPDGTLRGLAYEGPVYRDLIYKLSKTGTFTPLYKFKPYNASVGASPDGGFPF